MMPSRLRAGVPDKLGSHWDGLGINFAVFSAHAERVELCLFDARGRHEIQRFTLPECTDEVHHGYLPGAGPGLLYGYRAYGPYQPEQGHRFNPNKLLIDPYARALSGRLIWSDALYGYRIGTAQEDLSFDRRDSAFAVPKSVVTAESQDRTWALHSPPRHPWSETIIYEAHLRGLTRQRSDLPERVRGTFAGLAQPQMIEHFQRLGVTAIELMPVHAFAQDRFLVERKLSNYWGYSTLGFFAPEPRYCADPAHASAEIGAAIDRLHAAGIEIFLDVVYNHTCEGGELGPTLSWRGLDNASYYRLLPDAPRYCINDSGCGNTLNIAHPRVLQMVVDSLRYWATNFQIDGFRFDLATVLGREASGFDPGSGFFDAVRQDPVLLRCKLIAEPWDLGLGGYQLGNFPPGFAEWNACTRDTLRRFWRGDSSQRPELAKGLMGSPELFEHHRRRTYASVNFITSHDGFTLRDLLSYAERHNEANKENNLDGHSDNLSINFGTEGISDDAAIEAMRNRVARAMLATLFVCFGTPMLVSGDEIGRTQGGNNNAYCQDNSTSWLDWERVDPLWDLRDFIGRLSTLRWRHASLRSAQFLHGRYEIAPGLTDTEWFDETGSPLTAERWADGAAHLLALRRAVVEHDAPDVTLLLINGSVEDRNFVIPAPRQRWSLEFDSADSERSNEWLDQGSAVIVTARSVVILAASDH